MYRLVNHKIVISSFWSLVQLHLVIGPLNMVLIKKLCTTIIRSGIVIITNSTVGTRHDEPSGSLFQFYQKPQCSHYPSSFFYDNDIIIKLLRFEFCMLCQASRSVRVFSRAFIPILVTDNTVLEKFIVMTVIQITYHTGFFSIRQNKIDDIICIHTCS